jgi:hypothetical protein
MIFNFRNSNLTTKGFGIQKQAEITCSIQYWCLQLSSQNMKRIKTIHGMYGEVGCANQQQY